MFGAYNQLMIGTVLYVGLSMCYVMLYRLAISPPHNWITDVFLWLTWSCVIFNVLVMCVMWSRVTKSMSRVMIAEIHMMLPEYRVIAYFFSMFACVLVLYEANHVWTSMMVGVTGGMNMWFVWCLLLNPTKSHDTDDDLLVKAVENWDAGAFDRVSTYAEHMKLAEIVWLINTIEKNHGSQEADAARRLLNS